MMPADSAAPDASRGSLEQVTQAPDGRLIVEGWARDLGPPGDADAVVLAWVRPDGASRVVVFCDLWHKRLPGEAKGHAARRRAWRGELGASAIPQRRAQLTAWALDARSGRAFRLDGGYLSTPAHLR